MEQDYAHWGALTDAEQNIVREEFRPLNSPEINSLFWSASKKARYQYNPLIYKEIIKKLWPQLF